MGGFVFNTPEDYSLGYTEQVEDICIHIINSEGNTVYYSKGCEKIEGYKKEDILGKHIKDSYWSNDNEAFDEETSMHLKVLKTKQAVKNIPMTYYNKKGRLIRVISSTYPIIKNGIFAGAMCLFKDVTDLINMQSVIEDMQKIIHRENISKLNNGTSYTFGNIIGQNKQFLNTIEIAKKMAVGSSQIMIIGETGSGKELFAQSIHNYSDHSRGPFIAINCSAIPETLIESILFGTAKGSYTGASEKKGLFEEAQDGTLFLDEINSMSLMLQAKILRILEEKKVRRVGGTSEIKLNCKILSASNISTSDLIKNKVLRDDLFYRLAASTIDILPLRKRPDDIEVLINHFIKDNNKIMKRNVQQVSNNCLELLTKYSWPGNVRQLKHAIDYSFNLLKFNENTLNIHHLPQYICDSVKMNQFNNTFRKNNEINLKSILNTVEQNLIVQSIKNHNGNYSQAAKSLGISRQSLYYRMKILDINID